MINSINIYEGIFVLWKEHPSSFLFYLMSNILNLYLLIKTRKIKFYKQLNID